MGFKTDLHLPETLELLASSPLRAGKGGLTAFPACLLVLTNITFCLEPSYQGLSWPKVLGGVLLLTCLVQLSCSTEALWLDETPDTGGKSRLQNSWG